MNDLPDVDELALTLWGEARGEPVEGRIAIGCVVRNRLHVGRWGASYGSVVHAPAQFSCWASVGGAANYQALMAFRQRVDDEGGAMVDDPLWQETRWVAQGLVDDVTLDRVKGATHYHEQSILPTWAKGQSPACKVGQHLFYRGIS